MRSVGPSLIRSSRLRPRSPRVRSTKPPAARLANFAWPAQGLPIALAVVAWCAVKSISADVIVPLVTKRPLDRSWPIHFIHGVPGYAIGSALAVGFATVIEQRQWEVAVVAAVPLYFAYRAYAAHLTRADEERRRTEVREFLDQGMAVVDSAGLVTLWDEGLERILNVSARKGGRPVTGGGTAGIGKNRTAENDRGRVARRRSQDACRAWRWRRLPVFERCR